MAILLSIQATAWADATVRTWFFTAVNRMFASRVATAPSQCGEIAVHWEALDDFIRFRTAGPIGWRPR
jgi:hypothetical protein